MLPRIDEVPLLALTPTVLLPEVQPFVASGQIDAAPRHPWERCRLPRWPIGRDRGRARRGPRSRWPRAARRDARCHRGAGPGARRAPRRRPAIDSVSGGRMSGFFGTTAADVVATWVAAIATLVVLGSLLGERRAFAWSQHLLAGLATGFLALVAISDVLWPRLGAPLIDDPTARPSCGSASPSRPSPPRPRGCPGRCRSCRRQSLSGPSPRSRWAAPWSAPSSRRSTRASRGPAAGGGDRDRCRCGSHQRPRPRRLRPRRAPGPPPRGSGQDRRAGSSWPVSADGWASSSSRASSCSSTASGSSSATGWASA